MSKQYANLYTMAKTSVKFQNDWPKTVGGVALTSQLLTNGQTNERTGHGTTMGWSGGAKVSCILCHWGVQLDIGLQLDKACYPCSRKR